MASNPPAECCATGVEHEGNPTGQMIRVGTYDAYLARPTNTASARKDTGILFIPDVLGIWRNSQLLADEFASSGYTTLIIDVLNGDVLKPNQIPTLDWEDWFKRGTNGIGGHTPTEIDPIVENALLYMKNELGCKTVGSVGYCFAAKYVIRHLKQGRIDAGFIAHPSFVLDEELAAIAGPLSVAAAETDSRFTPEGRHKSEQILQKTGQPYQINLYSGVGHGFAVRMGLEKKVERFAKNQARKQAVDFFDEWLNH